MLKFYSIEDKQKIIALFVEGTVEALKGVKMYGSLKESMENDSPDMCKALINKTVEAIRAAVPEDIEVPPVSTYISMSGDDKAINMVDLIIRSKLRADFSFKFENSFVLCDDIYELVSDFIKCVYIELISDSLARENLKEVNKVISEVVKEANLGFEVEIVAPLGNSGKKISSITDEKIVFVADEDKVFELNNLLIFSEPSIMVTEDSIKKSFDDEVAVFAQAQTTPQFVGVHDPLIGYICGISKMVKPFTLIKKVYSKNIRNLRGSKESIAYLNEDKMYSAISVSAEGTKEVILKPFNVDTLEVVDTDVLAKL